MSGYCGAGTNNRCLNDGTNVPTGSSAGLLLAHRNPAGLAPGTGCSFSGMPLGQPFQGSLKFKFGHWDTLGSHNGISPFTYGMPQELFHNPEAIRHVAPYPYRGETEAAMSQIFDG